MRHHKNAALVGFMGLGLIVIGALASPANGLAVFGGVLMMGAAAAIETL